MSFGKEIRQAIADIEKSLYGFKGSYLGSMEHRIDNLRGENDTLKEKMQALEAHLKVKVYHQDSSWKVKKTEI